MKKITILSLTAASALMLAGCTDPADYGSNATETSVTNSYTASEEATIIVVSGSDIGCYSMENNGSECTSAEAEDAYDEIVREL